MLAVLLASCSGPALPSPTDGGVEEEGPEGLVSGDVIAITDGDTFDFETGSGRITVRLLGVNAPEDDECLHDEATDALTLDLASGQVGLEPHGLDQFRRTLAYVWAGDDLVNVDLVNTGLAIATTPGDDETQGSALLAAEETAYQESIGLWAPTACGGSRIDADLVIDTSDHDPPGADGDVLHLERITITNDGDGPVDISGWALRDESSANRFRFPDGSTIDPGAAFEVTSDNQGWEPGGGPVWNNSGDMALLLTPEGAVFARLRYGP